MKKVMELTTNTAIYFKSGIVQKARTIPDFLFLRCFLTYLPCQTLFCESHNLRSDHKSSIRELSNGFKVNDEFLSIPLHRNGVRKKNKCYRYLFTKLISIFWEYTRDKKTLNDLTLIELHLFVICFRAKKNMIPFIIFPIILK